MMDDDHQALLKVPCTTYSALSPTAPYATGGVACSSSSSSASQSVPFPCVDMLPKIFEAPVSALMSSSVASTPIPPDIDTLISTVAGSNASPKFRQSHQQVPNDGVFVHLSTTPAPPPPPPLPIPPGSLMDDVVNISASPGVKIIGTSSEQSAPVRLLPDLPQQPVKDQHLQQQVRILPNSRALPSSEAVQLMPDGQVNLKNKDADILGPFNRPLLFYFHPGVRRGSLSIASRCSRPSGAVSARFRTFRPPASPQRCCSSTNKAHNSGRDAGAATTAAGGRYIFVMPRMFM